jgi:hypothetical protein
MKAMKWISMAALAAACWAAPAWATDDDLFDRAPWFGTLGLSYYHLEGDVEAEPGFGLAAKWATATTPGGFRRQLGFHAGAVRAGRRTI